MTEYMIHCTFPKHCNFRLRKQKIIFTYKAEILLGVGWWLDYAHGEFEPKFVFFFKLMWSANVE